MERFEHSKEEQNFALLLKQLESLFSEPDKQEKFESFVYRMTKDVDDFIHKKKFRQLVLADRSARPLYTPLREYWKLRYSNDALPQIFFINPEGAKNSTQSQEVLRVKFEKEHPHLYKNRDQPTFIFDICTHSGDTIRRLKNIFPPSLFPHASYGVIYDSREEGERKNNPIEYAYPFDRNRDPEMCYPFGTEEYLTKRKGSLYSHVARDADRVRISEDVIFSMEMVKMKAREIFPRDQERQMVYVQETMEQTFAKEEITSAIRLSRGDVETVVREHQEGRKERETLRAIIQTRFEKDRILSEID